MSMPAGYVRCNGCEFEGVMQCRPATLQYQLPNGHVVEGYRRFVWCFVCENVTEAEEKMDAVSIQSEIDALQSRRSNFFVRMVDKALGGGDADRAELEKLEARLTLAQMRKSPPRCLRCSNSTVEAIVLDAQGTSNIVHSCGRRLFAVPEDSDAPRFFYKSEVITLDVEGRRF